jgi:hypothetical protein
MRSFECTWRSRKSLIPGPSGCRAHRRGGARTRAERHPRAEAYSNLSLESLSTVSALTSPHPRFAYEDVQLVIHSEPPDNMRLLLASRADNFYFFPAVGGELVTADRLDARAELSQACRMLRNRHQEQFVLSTKTAEIVGLAAHQAVKSLGYGRPPRTCRRRGRRCRAPGLPERATGLCRREGSHAGVDREGP